VGCRVVSLLRLMVCNRSTIRSRKCANSRKEVDLMGVPTVGCSTSI
jgi:hypothetical protein